MPKCHDIQSILILGAGPIVIGQACEFDYSGAQACKALKEEGYRVILVNSNPATIMTDPDLADATYIEPITWEVVEKIIATEKPDAILPTMGGQTALNCALDLSREGVLEKYGIALIGASKEAIDKAEDREKFSAAMESIGLEMARSAVAHSLEEAQQVQAQIGFPTIIRPSFTMGGSGGGIAYNQEEFIEICERGLSLSPTSELLIEESLLGWKEYEMEVVRDKNDNCIIVCSIENLDPMGIHTGDSITVAPAQTLTDKEYQCMRDASIAILREIGVETGGSNVQFAVNPDNGRLIVIEMNPRVSRSSALASKATGFPIAKVAAKLAVGYTLDELTNEITGGKTPASFEPTIDYVVTKIPRFTFEKFPQADARLTTQMKSVGEVMAMGRTFMESLQKAIRGLEEGKDGFDPIFETIDEEAKACIERECRVPGAQRLWYVGEAFRAGLSLDEVFSFTKIDPWFLAQIQKIIETEQALQGKSLDAILEDELYALKQMGFSDRRLGALLNLSEHAVRKQRHAFGIHPVYKRVDSCAAEFETTTAYLYSTYEQYCEARPSDAKKIIILGGGPNRIGQGIEFDYCCVHAAYALREAGFETIMVNCNPETVSTDYDTSDRLYFESLTLEDVLEIVRVEKPQGVLIQYGGQTPLKLARSLEQAGVPIIGTSPDAIDCAEDRERFQQLVDKLKLKQPPNGLARSVEDAVAIAQGIGYPLLLRPSYVLGGRAMEIIYNEEDLAKYMQRALAVFTDAPVLLDRFLEDAIEVDVDCVSDGKQVIVAGIMEHIEQAGVHSGDSSCSLPTFSLSDDILKKLKQQVTEIALELGVVGLMNTQFAIQKNNVYLLEVNPRASRTIPYVSKAVGMAFAKIGAKCKVGMSLATQGITKVPVPDLYSVKMPVFPFVKFPGVDPILGPEMKSTGEVMGMGETFSAAYAKAQLAAGASIALGKSAFLSVRDEDKPGIVTVATRLIEAGFDIVATKGTAKALSDAGIACTPVNKVMEGQPHIVDKIKNSEIGFIVNTTIGKQALKDSYTIRRSAVQYKVYYTTTLAAGLATSQALADKHALTIYKLQAVHQTAKADAGAMVQ